MLRCARTQKHMLVHVFLQNCMLLLVLPEAGAQALMTQHSFHEIQKNMPGITKVYQCKCLPLAGRGETWTGRPQAPRPFYISTLILP